MTEVMIVEHGREHEELVAAAALDALDSADQDKFEANLVMCETCYRELAELREIAGELALLAPLVEPPPHLKQRILSQILEESRVGTAAPEGGVTSLEELGALKQRRPAKMAQRWLVGAAAALMLVVGAGWVGDVLRDARAGQEQSDILADIALDPSTRRVVLEDLVTGTTQATVLLKQGNVVVSAHGLPVNEPGKMYVLWAEDNKGNLEAVAGFNVGPEERGTVLETEVSGPVRALAISLEEGTELPEKPTYAVARGILGDL